MKRIFLIVLDSVGAGELPDAEKFGDKGAHTLKSISKSSYLHIPNLQKLGIGNIEGLSFLVPSISPLAAHGKISEKSIGKDTTVGHWEIAGIVSKKTFPTYPNGFPDKIISSFSAATGRGILCNKPYSGTEVIKDYGQEHIKSGKLIIYTSADSVFQIAAHEEIIPINTLYAYCNKARFILQGDDAVARVIARPFIGSYPNFTRTDNRRDFSLEPPGKTILDYFSDNGFDTVSVGKISDIFSERGIKKILPAHNNLESMAATFDALNMEFTGLCFANFVDFDMKYGHRRDIDGYARALSEFDLWLGKFISRLSSEDMLIITADHGCDPGYAGTDHTREYTPVLIFGKAILPVNLGIRNSYADISASLAEIMNIPYFSEGISFAKQIFK